MDRANVCALQLAISMTGDQAQKKRYIYSHDEMRPRKVVWPEIGKEISQGTSDEP